MSITLPNGAEFEQFAHETERFINEIEQMNAVLQTHIDQHRDGWDERERQQVCAELVEISKNLERYVHASQNYVPMLEKRAGHARDRINQARSGFKQG